MSDGLYQWFAAAPWRYWLFAVPAGVAFVVAIVCTRRIPRWLFLVALGAFLVGFRWPILVTNGEASADESQIIAGAMTLRHQPVFWRDVDAHAIGPAVIYPLTFLSFAGAPLDYESARIYGLVLSWVGLAAGCWLLGDYFGEGWARAGVAPGAAFIAFTRHWDFAHYSAEIAATAFLGLGVAALFVGIRRTSALLCGLGAAALAATLWIKLQSVPIAAMLLFGGLVAARGRARIPIVIGALAAVAIPAVAVAAAGAWSDFTASYFRAGANYLGQGSLGRGTVLARFFTAQETGFPVFAWPLLLAVLVFAYRGLKTASESRALLASLCAAVVAALAVAAAPGRQYSHYLELLVLPLTLAATAAVAPVYPGHRTTLFGFLAATIGPQFAFLLSPQAYKFDFPAGSNHLARNEIASMIIAQAPAGARLTVWGWDPQLYVLSGLPQATREAHTEREIEVDPLREFYRDRFLADFDRHPPEIFVEAIVPTSPYQDRRAFGISTWPELGRRIALDYQLVGSSAAGHRVYRRLRQ